MRTPVNFQYQVLPLRKRFLSHAGGFTLVELMVVVAIIGILTTIALPAYTEFVQRGKAAEATSTLADLRVKMEQYYQDNRTYVGADLLVPGPCSPPPANVKYFAYACNNLGDTTYNIVANGVAAQKMGSFDFTINQANVKSSTFNGHTGATCWLNSKNGSC